MWTLWLDLTELWIVRRRTLDDLLGAWYAFIVVNERIDR